jgi:hypothetical protein
MVQVAVEGGKTVHGIYFVACENSPSLSATQIGDSGRGPRVGRGLKQFLLCRFVVKFTMKFSFFLSHLLQMKIMNFSLGLEFVVFVAMVNCRRLVHLCFVFQLQSCFA